jgi:hypothetical protein
MAGTRKKARKLRLFAHFPAIKGCRTGVAGLPVSHEIP